MKILLCFVFLILLGSCGTNKKAANNKVKQDHMILATLWIQTAAEVRALSYQAFNLAKERLTYDLKRKRRGKKRAVVLDIDETVLDNSPYQAQGIMDNTAYPTGWSDWVSRAEAKPLAGAKEFLQFAKSKGVEIFYISNRKVRGLDATYKNLKGLGLPVKRENLLLRDKDKSKKSRRSKVLKNYRIVFLMGDNLGDFTELFDGKDLKERELLVDRRSQEFGRRFIVLPNPMYGDWEGAVYKYNYRQSLLEKENLRKTNLRTIR